MMVLPFFIPFLCCLRLRQCRRVHTHLTSTPFRIFRSAVQTSDLVGAATHDGRRGGDGDGMGSETSGLYANCWLRAPRSMSLINESIVVTRPAAYARAQ